MVQGSRSKLFAKNTISSSLKPLPWSIQGLPSSLVKFKLFLFIFECLTYQKANFSIAFFSCKTYVFPTLVLRSNWPEGVSFLSLFRRYFPQSVNKQYPHLFSFGRGVNAVQSRELSCQLFVYFARPSFTPSWHSSNQSNNKVWYFLSSFNLKQLVKSTRLFLFLTVFQSKIYQAIKCYNT